MIISDMPLNSIYEVLDASQIDILQKLLTQFPEYFVKSELIIYIVLAALYCSDIYNQIDESLDNIDVDTADEPSLKLLGQLLGYKWNDSLSLNTNRSRIKYFQYRKKYRGTISSLKNLIKTGYSEEGFFSNNASNSIDIIEDSPRITVVITDNEDTVILRDNIEEVRPAGTVLRFLYQFTLGFIDICMKEMVAWTLHHLIFEPSYFDTSITISEWYMGVDASLGDIAGFPILDYNTTFRFLAGMDDPDISYRPEEQISPITVGEYDGLKLLVNEQDYKYLMYVKQFDKYFKYSKSLVDGTPYPSVVMSRVEEVAD